MKVRYEQINSSSHNFGSLSPCTCGSFTALPCLGAVRRLRDIPLFKVIRACCYLEKLSREVEILYLWNISSMPGSVGDWSFLDHGQSTRGLSKILQGVFFSLPSISVLWQARLMLGLMVTQSFLPSLAVEVCSCNHMHSFYQFVCFSWSSLQVFPSIVGFQ